MAKRYFNIFRNHVMVFIILIVLVCLSEFTTGSVSMAAKVAAGALMIYSVISYSIWLIKTPGRVNEEEL